MSALPGPLRDLPEPPAAERERSRALAEVIGARMDARGGVIGFDAFMNAALYEPGLGYYVAGVHAFGPDGDFTTAPELSPLFARCVAGQLSEVAAELDRAEVLELGAGSGRLAAGVLRELGERGDWLPSRYRILEVSPLLKAAQQERILPLAQALGVAVEWLPGLPETPMEGVILANEVVDALPAERFLVSEQGPRPLAVTRVGSGFGPALGPRDECLAARVASIEKHLGRRLPEGYRSELRPLTAAWVGSLADRLARGMVLVLDYGYERPEYFHPERADGTLRCHYRHRAHEDPHVLVGLQDISVHVDFSDLTEGARRAGLDLVGYSTQAWFLIGAGLLRIMDDRGEGSLEGYYQQVNEVKTLTLPGGMGEAVKVAAFGRGLARAPSGFSERDLSHRL